MRLKLVNKLTLAFCSTQIFNSKDSFLSFLETQKFESDNLIKSMRKWLYELIKEYIEKWHKHIIHYLEDIKVGFA